MKRVLGLLLLGGTIAGLYSCKKTINCRTPQIRRVIFYSPLTSLRVPDTSYILTKYVNDTTFSLVSDIFPETRLTSIDLTKVVYMPENGTETYDFDWEIVLKPSMKKYRLSKIDFQSETSKTHQCTNTVTYKLNDTMVTKPGFPYSSTPTLTDDIQIEYY